jgi:hypothetical protein
MTFTPAYLGSRTIPTYCGGPTTYAFPQRGPLLWVCRLAALRRHHIRHRYWPRTFT